MDDSNRDRSFHDEQRPEQRARPLRGATSDLSETGCYIESIFPFPVGTTLEMSLQVDTTVLALGTVVTCDPQVGNGIKFTKMLPEDREQLRAYLEAAQRAKDQP